MISQACILTKYITSYLLILFSFKRVCHIVLTRPVIKATEIVHTDVIVDTGAYHVILPVLWLVWKKCVTEILDTAWIVHLVTGEMYVIKCVHHIVMEKYVTRNTACVYRVVLLESLATLVKTFELLVRKTNMLTSTWSMHWWLFGELGWRPMWQYVLYCKLCIQHLVSWISHLQLVD